MPFNMIEGRHRETVELKNNIDSLLCHGDILLQRDNPVVELHDRRVPLA